MKIYSLLTQLTITLFLLTIGGCSSYENFKSITEDFELPSKIFKADYNQSWQAMLQVMKRFDIAEQNLEAGLLKTRWIDNAREINFTDAFNKSSRVKAAKFKIIINVSKGFRSTREVTKITIYKRQLIEQDILQGWKEVASDLLEEKALLYRIGRLIAIDNKLKKIEKLKEKQQLQKF